MKRLAEKKKGRQVMVLAGACALSVSLLCGCGTEKNGSGAQETGERQEAVSSGKVFGSFQAETLTGESVTEAALEESALTMVNIWGTFCGPCISEMPDLGALDQEYADRGFRVVGIISDVTEPGDETAQEIVEQTGADYMHILASEDLRNGALRVINVVPTTVFVNSEGKRVGEAYAGSRSKEEWAEIIEALLAEVGA